MTYRELLLEGIKALKEAETEDAETDARILMEHFTGADREFLLLHGDEEISGKEVCIKQFRDAVNKRINRIPVQHITGYADFMGLKFRVSPDVLIPRFDTEILVEEALKELHGGMKILDMCTGSGCILISLLKYSNNVSGVGADISEKALKIAEYNALNILKNDYNAKMRIDNAEDTETAGESDVQSYNFSFVQSDLFENIEDEFDIIVSNPPYIKTGIINTLAPEVREHDPFIALDGGEDGLAFYKRIVNEMGKYLKPNGVCLFETGFDEAHAISTLLSENGYKYIEIIKDLSGLDRVVKAVKPQGFL